MIFDGMLRNLDNVSGKFLMYLRFIQTFLDKQLDGLPTHMKKYDGSFHTKKVFANMKRIGKRFSGKETPLFPTMVGPNQVQIEDELKRTKTAQQTKIVGLERRVKKLEKKHMSRNHKLKRLYKVGLTARVISSSNDEALDKEDTSKQGRIDKIDADEDIALVSTHDYIVQDEGIEDVGEEEVVTNIKMIVDAAQVTTVIADIPISAAETIVTTAPTITAESTKTNVKAQDKGKGKAKLIEEPEMPKKRKHQIRADEELAVKLQAKNDEEERVAKEKAQQVEKRKREFFAAKRTEEKRNRPLTKAQQRSLMCTYLKNMDGWKPRALKNKSFAEIQELFNKAMKRINNFVDFRTELVEEKRSKKQKVENDKESEELKKFLEIIPDDGDDVTIDATPLSTKSPTIVDYKIYKEGKKSYCQNFRVEAKVKNWKIFDSCGVHCVTMQLIPYYLLVEKMCPITHYTLNQMFNNVKLQVDYECEMAYELLRLITRKRPRSTRGQSSTSQEISMEEKIQRFRVFENGVHQLNYDTLTRRPIHSGDVIDWEFLARQNLDQAFFDSISTDPFFVPQWGSLFHVNEPIYRELGARDKNLIYGGMFVTRIARSFGLLTNEIRDALSIEPSPHVFKKKLLISVGFIMELQNGICVWPATQAVEEEDEAEEEAGGDACNEGAGGSADMYRNMSQGDWQVRQARWMDQQNE
uniref:Uncharacterized protein n=1 Tax=Tanacetum cinerariifolium TaxID=118510 RepID=A0A6L2LTT1_TANCI|nr:hypothetical protein [Tanacetum cinerariifolium]